jgi:hypothetical protein
MNSIAARCSSRSTLTSVECAKPDSMVHHQLTLISATRIAWGLTGPRTSDRRRPFDDRSAVSCGLLRIQPASCRLSKSGPLGKVDIRWCPSPPNPGPHFGTCQKVEVEVQPASVSPAKSAGRQKQSGDQPAPRRNKNHRSHPVGLNHQTAAAHDWWTPEGSKRILSGDRYVKEIEATTPVVQ